MRRITLKEKYQQKNDLLFESIILEEFNKELMAQAANLFKTLLSINFNSAGLGTFASARDNAVKNVDEIISNKSERGLIRKFISLFKNKQDSLMDSLAFCDSIQNFFEVLNQYIDAKKTGISNPDSRKLSELVLGTNKQFMSGNPKNTADVTEKMKTFEQLIQTGLQPDGVLKKLLGNSWQKKYLKNNYKAIAKELLNANVKKLQDLCAQIENIKNVDVIAQNAAGATQAASKQTTQTTGTEQTKSSEQTGSTTPTNQTKDSSVGGTPQSKEAKKALQIADKIYTDISSDFNGLDQDIVKKVIAILAHNEKVKL